MAEIENESSNPKKKHPSLGEVIRTWAVPISAVIVIVLDINQIISYVVRSEINPLKQSVASLERKFDIFEGKFTKFEGNLTETDRRISKLETEVGLNSPTLKLILQTLGRLERKLDALLNQDGGGSGG